MNRQMKELLIKTARQLANGNRLVCSEADAIRWDAAFEKAEHELAYNKTISFKNGILRFTSRDSYENRIVTKNGCSTFCKCGNRISYHRALWHIFNEAQVEIAAQTDARGNSAPVAGTEKITESNVIYIKKQLNGQKAEYCGNIRI